MQTSDYERLAMRTEASQVGLRNRRVDQLHARVTTLGRSPSTYSEHPHLISGDNAMRLENGVRGLTDEVGELNAILKKWIEYGKPLDIVNAKEEVGDCLWRLTQICKALGTTLTECMELNIAKLSARYPEAYSEHLANNRDLDAERKALEKLPGEAPHGHFFTQRGLASDMRGHCRICQVDWTPENDQEACPVQLSDSLKAEKE